MIDYNSLNYQPFIKNALEEDIGSGDHTSLSCIPRGTTGKAKLLVKDNGIIAGTALSIKIFHEVDPSLKLEYYIHDGSEIKIKDVVFIVEGSVHSILKAERLVLNVMQRMSGIATKTHSINQKLKGFKTKLLDTRKTTPGLRMIEKWAVKIGGGENHRIGLYDMILVKDNHIDYAGGVKPALTSIKEYKLKNPQFAGLEIEVEARTLDEVQEILECGGVKRILLDNFSFENLKKAVDLIAGATQTEASGGITEENVAEYAACGVDYISMGALTHSVKSLDLSLKAFD